MKSLLLSIAAVTSLGCFGLETQPKTFKDICEQINPVENIYSAHGQSEDCIFRGAPGELYDLSLVAELNRLCLEKGPDHQARIYNNRYSDESTPKDKWETRLIVTCWDYSNRN